ncbi:IS66 family insertion sequence element accessory protein TnpA [Lacrimispora brassicae]
MTKAQKDEYWMDCIQQCRVSGLSDYAWCNQNGIPTSSFYYNIKRLRKKASMIPASVPKVVEKTEIVPIHYNELQETKVVLPKKQTDSIAIRLETA